ncbi:MAG: DegT/DnrJ/EryC1/StrS family aminotransferase, partial [Candidatus Omnitrophica bacterium]|nr:DegT/DnrJ/EryC1/StrS family aminotransferase [Candidatus Omnitrophota bacterium]
PDPGSEIITTPITDMGALTPIMYQGCIPVFADIDPYSYNVTAETIQKRISPKTRAIIVTHLFGNPCEMAPIMKLAAERKIPVIEDCAQSFLAKIDGRNTGVIGDIGAFSFQQGKHMTTGEGGIVLTNDEAYARRIRLFVNKAWGYGDPKPDHYFVALNYRLTELQGAVAIAQLGKLEKNVQNRQKAASLMDELLSGIPGVRAPQPPKGATHVYWKYCLDVDPEAAGCDVVQMATALKAFGIFSAPRYIQKPSFRCEVLREGRMFGADNAPLDQASMSLWQDEEACRREYPGSYQALSRMLVLPWNEFYTEAHVRYIAEKIKEVLKDAQKPCGAGR